MSYFKGHGAFDCVGIGQFNLVVKEIIGGKVMAKLPNFYKPARIGTIFFPDIAAIAAEAADAKLKPAAVQKIKVQLIIVDMQVDFCHEGGALYVPGAEQDIRRLIEFIYRNAEHITNIICSLDSHLPHQIFHSAWWIDKEGNHPSPLTVISHSDVINGKWKPVREHDWSIRYISKLKEQAKKELTIWPYHVLIGSLGNIMDPELFSAVLWHALARSAQPIWWTKGSIPQTEHYSIIQPEIPVPEHPQGGRSRDFINMIQTSQIVFIAGEAASHCVLETVEDLVEEFSGQPEILRRLYILRDCTSPVRHPQINFAEITNKRFAEFAEKGVRFMNSTDPIPL